eukprot:g6559.t1
MVTRSHSIAFVALAALVASSWAIHVDPNLDMSMAEVDESNHVSVHDLATGKASHSQVAGLGDYMINGVATVLASLAEAHGTWDALHEHNGKSAEHMGSFLEESDEAVHGMDHAMAQQMGGHLLSLAVGRAAGMGRAPDKKKGAGESTCKIDGSAGDVDPACLKACAEMKEGSKERTECEEGCEGGDPEDEDDPPMPKAAKQGKKKMAVVADNGGDDPNAFVTAKQKALRDLEIPYAQDNVDSADAVLHNLQDNRDAYVETFGKDHEKCKQTATSIYSELDDVTPEEAENTMKLCDIGADDKRGAHAEMVKVATHEKELWAGKLKELQAKEETLEKERMAKVDEAKKAVAGRPTGSFSAKVAQLFESKVEAIKKGPKDILAFFLSLKFGLGWGIPITLAALLNPKLPGLAITCAPIQSCVKAIYGNAKSTIGTIFAILSIPMQIIFAAVKAALNFMGLTSVFKSMGSAIGSMFKKKNKDDANQEGDEQTGGDPDEADTPAAEKGKGDSFSKTAATIDAKTDDKSQGLVPVRETRSKAGSDCALCPIKLTFALSLGVMDVVFGFGITGYAVKTGIGLGNVATAIKCAKGCIKKVLEVMNPFRSKKRAVERVYFQDTCTPHSVGLCTMIAKTRKCAGEWKDLKKVKGIEHPLKTLADTKITDGMLKGGLKMAGGMFKKKPKNDPKAGRQICELFESMKTKFVVSRSKAGDLQCEKDANDKDSCDKKDHHCGELNLGRGCEIVHKKMIRAEKDGCLWEDMDETSTDIMDRCLS